jgi:DNA-binding transcriptional LysR family regulator
MADRRLQVFHAVARKLSFTKAAEALHMTQPAVTFQIRQLEEQFRTRLFDRAQGRIALTPAGVTALEYAERVLALSNELELRMKELGSRPAGPLLVGASTTIADYLLPPLLAEFKSRHPAVQPRLVVANSEAVQARVADRSLDLGFIEGESRLPSLASEVCCDDELQVVCAPSHPLAKLKSVTPRTLARHALVRREPGSGTREVIDRYLQKAGVAPDSLHVVMELGSPEAIKGLVATGLGFTIVSRATVAKETRLGQLVRLPLQPRLKRRLFAIYPDERLHSRLVTEFVRFAKEKLGRVSGGG